jgi:hypothetical protein
MKRSLVCVLSIMALALALPLFAQTERSISGRVVTSSPTELVIQTEDGRQMTFNVDTQTMGASGLNSGSRVTVRYHELAGGTFHAAIVTSSTTTSTSDVTTERTTRTTVTEPTDTTRTTTTEPTGATTTTRTRRTTTPTERTSRTTTTATETTTAGTAEPAAKMPATASPVPLVGLAGLLALSGALGVRALRRRTT